MTATTATQRWSELNGLRSAFIRRCEGWAHLTVRKVCLPQGYNQYSTDLQHDWQSVGAQSVNHLANRLMLALFAPSRPFGRLDPSPLILAKLQESGAARAELDEQLAAAEADAVKELDQSASRPKLYEALKHLIITGNVLMYLGKDAMRIQGIKNYCVKRDTEGKLLEAVICEEVRYDELAQELREHLQSLNVERLPDTMVSLFKWIVRTDKGDYAMTQWVDEFLMPSAFNGKWPENKLPYRFLTWDLADDSDYGTGLVEDYAGDFQSLSSLSQATIEGALLSSEYRWLANPAGMTKPEDFENAANGAVIPGTKGDLTLIQAEVGNALTVQRQIAEDYIQRIGRGFLLSSAVTRNAERVTAVEMRMQAEELETSLGGVYSRLAVDMQRPIFSWLLVRIKLTFKGTEFTPIIVTGLDALSRNGDVENMKRWLADMASLTGLPPALLGMLNLQAIAQSFASGYGIRTSELMKSEAQLKAEQQQAQQQQLQQQAESAGVDVAAQQAVNQQEP